MNKVYKQIQLVTIWARTDKYLQYQAVWGILIKLGFPFY